MLALHPVRDGALDWATIRGLTTFDGQFRALFVTANTNQAGNRTGVQYGQFRSVDVDVAVGPQVQASTFGVTAAPARRLGPLRR
jgi:hypothetical protein